MGLELTQQPTAYIPARLPAKGPQRDSMSAKQRDIVSAAKKQFVVAKTPIMSVLHGNTSTVLSRYVAVAKKRIDQRHAQLHETAPGGSVWPDTL